MNEAIRKATAELEALACELEHRGTRTISDTDFQAVTPDARSKDHFVLVDAVGVCERLKTDEPSLGRKRSVPFDKLLTSVALVIRQDWVATGQLSDAPEGSDREAKAARLSRYAEVRWSPATSPLL